MHVSPVKTPYVINNVVKGLTSEYVFVDDFKSLSHEKSDVKLVHSQVLVFAIQPTISMPQIVNRPAKNIIKPSQTAHQSSVRSIPSVHFLFKLDII